MKRLASLILLLLAGCSDAPDGYVFGQSEYRRDEITLTVVTYPGVASLRAAAETRGVAVEQGRALMAFSEIRGTHCTMHIVEPEVKYQPQWIGHETVHCIRGRWHK